MEMSFTKEMNTPRRGFLEGFHRTLEELNNRLGEIVHGNDEKKILIAIAKSVTMDLKTQKPRANAVGRKYAQDHTVHILTESDQKTFFVSVHP
jgi:hypothetical protein